MGAASPNMVAGGVLVDLGEWAKQTGFNYAEGLGFS